MFYDHCSFKMLLGNEVMVTSPGGTVQKHDWNTKRKQKLGRLSLSQHRGLRRMMFSDGYCCSVSVILRLYLFLCLHSHKHTVSPRFHTESICLAKLTVTSAGDSNLDCSLPKGDRQPISA